MNDILDNRLRQIVALCKEPHTSRRVAQKLGLSKGQVIHLVKALRDAKCLSINHRGEHTRYGWIPTYLTIAEGPLPTATIFAQAKQKATFNGVQSNIGWLISYPTVKPQGGRKVMLGEAYHTVGSPRKLSAWHGYSCEMMG